MTGVPATGDERALWERSRALTKAIDFIDACAGQELAIHVDSGPPLESVEIMLDLAKVTCVELGGEDDAGAIVAALSTTQSSTPVAVAELLALRDKFIVDHGLWSDFVDTLPSPPAVESESSDGGALGWAKATAWHKHGIAWKHLERISQDELLAEARAAVAAMNGETP